MRLFNRLPPKTLLGVTSTTALLSTMTASTPTWPVQPYTPRHDTFPYTAIDFGRQDASADTSFYSAPRFVTHIDDHAISVLGRYYASVLPRRGRILDFCSSWVSHYPPQVEDAVKRGELAVVGMGMEKSELDRNDVLNAGRIVQDLNVDPSIPDAVVDGTRQQLLDAATCVVSIDYLTRPVAVLTSLRERTRPGGTVHLTISNRCFPTKAVRRWLMVDEEERLQMVGDYLWFAGWRNVEIVTLCDGTLGEEEREGRGGGGDAQGDCRG